MNLRKKIVALSMVFALALGMATSAFAVDKRSTSDGFYQLLPLQNESLGLNVSHPLGDYSKLNGLAITLYTSEMNEDQLFKLNRGFSLGTLYIYSKILFDPVNRTGYVLNRDNGDSHCILYSAQAADEDDSHVTVNDGDGSGHAYYQLSDGDVLVATSLSKNARVYWRSPKWNDNELWIAK